MTTAHLVNIGNSKGLIIPSRLREKCHIKNNVQYEVVNNKIIISSADDEPRKDWKEKLLKLGADKDTSEVFMDNIPNETDKDWTW